MAIKTALSWIGARKFTIAAVFAVVAVGVVIWSEAPTRYSLRTSSSTETRVGTGEAQLVSVEPMGTAEGQMCETTPASANAALVNEFAQSNLLPASAAAADTAGTVKLDRMWKRQIRDPNPTFSAIAVEPESNMLVMTDENLFKVMEYDRRDETLPGARMTEPKRMIGGNKTKAEMMCGVYIDPKTLDTYVVNNDTQDWLAIFSKSQRGNTEPDRVLAVPHGTFGIAVDEGREELYLTVQHNNAIMVYRKMAQGTEKALREISGDKTGLEDPHGITIDTKRDLIFVSNHGSVAYRGENSKGGRGFVKGSGQFHPPSITVYKRDANGNIEPIRTIAGPKTRLNWPMQIAVNEENGDLFVANDMDHSVTVYKETDSGDVAPSRIITGPKTKVKNPTGIAIDYKNHELWVASMGNHTAALFPLTADGNVTPNRVIRGGPENELSLMIGNPGAVGYDTKREQILVPN